MKYRHFVVFVSVLALAACGGDDDGRSPIIGGSSSSSSSSTSSSSSSSSGTGSSVDNLFALAEFPIGMAVTAGNEPRSFLDIPEKELTINQHFSQLTAGNIMKMSYLHPSEDNYTYEQADAMIDWATANGKTVHGHTFIWHSNYQVPGWMTGYEGTDAEFEAMLNTHVSTIAANYATNETVISWDVVNEAIEETQSDCYRKSLFFNRIGKAYIPNAFNAANSAIEAAAPNRSVDLYYNDFNTEDGEGSKYACMLDMIDEWQEADVPIDGVGFQMHVIVDWPSIDSIRVAFEGVVARGLKVKITELDVRLNNRFGSGSFPQNDEFTPALAEQQKQRYKSIIATYLEVVPVELRGGVTIWGLWDGDSWLIELDGAEDWPLLFSGPENGPYEPKPALDGVAEALTGS